MKLNEYTCEPVKSHNRSDKIRYGAFSWRLNFWFLDPIHCKMLPRHANKYDCQRPTGCSVFYGATLLQSALLARAFRFAIRIDSPIHFKRIDSNDSFCKKIGLSIH